MESVALASTIPTDRLSHVAYEVSGVSSAGAAIDDQHRPTVSTLVAGPSYFATLGARIVEGREFTPFDGAASAPVVVVNERFASSTWPGERAPGKRLRLAGASDEWMTVVGVVGNIAQNDRMRQTMDPVVYLPFRQSSGASMAVFARTRVPPSTLVTDVRRQIRAMDSELIPSQPQSLTDILAESYQYRGISGAMFLLCAVIALLLAAIGLYAVIMHSVTQRTQEIGLRIAIGATTGDIRWLVVREGVLTVGLGLAIGVAVSLFVNRLLVSSLVQVSPADPGTYTVVCADAGAIDSDRLLAARASRDAPRSRRRLAAAIAAIGQLPTPNLQLPRSPTSNSQFFSGFGSWELEFWELSSVSIRTRRPRRTR